MKKFDLEAAKAGAPIITRDGREAKFVGHVPEASLYPLVAYIAEHSAPTTFTVEGKLYRSEDSKCDLFMKPQKRTIWLNIFKGNRSGSSTEYSEGDADWYESEEMAKIEAERVKIKPIYIAVPIEIEE